MNSRDRGDLSGDDRRESDKLDRNRRDPATGRFAIINLIRISGVVMILAGILIARAVIPWPEIVGYVLIVIGVAEFFFIPLVLAKAWRSQSE